MSINGLEGKSMFAYFYKVGGGILEIVAMVGSGLSIIFLICLGIKYMMGSLEEKAVYKERMLPYFIGALFVFGASTIAQIVFSVFNN